MFDNSQLGLRVVDDANGGFGSAGDLEIAAFIGVWMPRNKPSQKAIWTRPVLRRRQFLLEVDEDPLCAAAGAKVAGEVYFCDAAG